MEVLCLSHTTALKVLREMRIARAPLVPVKPFEQKGITLVARSLARPEVPYAASLDPGEDIHLLVEDRNRRRALQGARVHCSCIDVISDAYLRLSLGLIMSSPELLFLQMASVLTYEQLFLLGLELCGSYVPCRRIPRGFENDLAPASDPERLEAFLASVPGASGSKAARNVSACLCSGSASPQESRVYIKLACPRHRGGYGAKGIAMNHEVTLSREAAKIAGQTRCVIDFVYLGTKLAIEYDSRSVHDNVEQGQKDKRRRDALDHDGWSTLCLVPSVAQNPELFDSFARKTLKEIGQSDRIRRKGFEAKRRDLFRALAVSDR